MAKASDNQFPFVHLVPAAAPASPAAGSQRLYLDSADGNKLKRKDSAGTVTTIEGGSGSPTAWTTLPLTSGHVSHADTFGYTPQYRKVGDRVELRGTIRKSTGSFTGNTQVDVGTLPAGFLPTATAYGATGTQGSTTSGTGRCSVTSAGAVQMFVPVAVTWVSLDGMSFATT